VATAWGAGQLGDAQALTDGFRAAFVGATVIAAAGATVAFVALRQPKATDDEVEGREDQLMEEGERVLERVN
jgi:hypothetical protein